MRTEIEHNMMKTNKIFAAVLFTLSLAAGSANAQIGINLATPAVLKTEASINGVVAGNANTIQIIAIASRADNNQLIPNLTAANFMVSPVDPQQACKYTIKSFFTSSATNYFQVGFSDSSCKWEAKDYLISIRMNTGYSARDVQVLRIR